MTDTTEIRITVKGTNDAPIADAEVVGTVDEGAATITGQLTSTDLDDNATATFTLNGSVDAPAGFTLNEDGNYTFDPADSAYDHLNVGDTKTLVIPVTVTDDNGATDTTRITLTVTGTNDVPVAGSEVVKTIDEGAAAISGQLTSTDLDDNATFSFTSDIDAPAGFVLDENGSYTFDPADSAYDHLNVGDTQTLVIPVTVTDDNGATDTTRITVTVIGTNDAPVADVEAVRMVDVGADQITGQLTSSDVDDGATATYRISEDAEVPAGFELNANGSYSFDPNHGDYSQLDTGETLVINIPVTVTDEHGASDTSGIQINITGTNDAPVFEMEEIRDVVEGAAVITGQLTSSDLDHHATAEYSLSEGTDAPLGFVLNPNGSYSFDPGHGAYDHLNVGDTEVLTIPVTVTDDYGASDTSEIQITVTGTNDAPVAGAKELVAVDEGGASITGTLTSADPDDLQPRCFHQRERYNSLEGLS